MLELCDPETAILVLEIFSRLDTAALDLRIELRKMFLYFFLFLSNPRKQT